MTKRDAHSAANPVGHRAGNVAEFFDSFAAIYGEGRYFEPSPRPSVFSDD
jgi:hypothetical protein